MLELNAIYFHRPIVHGMRDYKPTPACEHTHTHTQYCPSVMSRQCCL